MLRRSPTSLPFLVLPVVVENSKVENDLIFDNHLLALTHELRQWQTIVRGCICSIYAGDPHHGYGSSICVDFVTSEFWGNQVVYTTGCSFSTVGACFSGHCHLHGPWHPPALYPATVLTMNLYMV